MKSKIILLGLISILAFACISIPASSVPTQDVNSLSTIIAGTAVAAFVQTQDAQVSSRKLQNSAILPTVAIPTFDSAPTVAPANQPTAAPCPPCTVVVDTWRFDIQEIHSDLGMDPSRQMVVLIGVVTNEGMKQDLFMATDTMVLKDSGGREYQQDMNGTFTAGDKYGTGPGGELNPGASEKEAWAYDVPATEKTFTIAAGDLAGSWGGDFIFTAP